jgi:hypothetical protein
MVIPEEEPTVRWLFPSSDSETSAGSGGGNDGYITIGEVTVMSKSCRRSPA